MWTAGLLGGLPGLIWSGPCPPGQHPRLRLWALGWGRGGWTQLGAWGWWIYGPTRPCDRLLCPPWVDVLTPPCAFTSDPV